MRSSDFALLALLQIPTAVLAAAGLYLALRLRSLGSVLVATSLVLSLLKSVGGNFIPKSTRNVFDEDGQWAGAMVDGGRLELLLGYSGFGLALLLAIGLVLVARDARLSGRLVVSSNTSLERTREG
jgi:hypothetical protein